uniref:Uncharacterized protein n=1 Tax=Knipowitschia caucasica TaxID=637954 RepID=A0AAV2LP15_KNICA
MPPIDSWLGSWLCGEDSAQRGLAWVLRLTELIQAVTLQPPTQVGGCPPNGRGPPVCWTCGRQAISVCAGAPELGGGRETLGVCVKGPTPVPQPLCPSPIVAHVVRGPNTLVWGAGLPPTEADDSDIGISRVVVYAGAIREFWAQGLGGEGISTVGGKGSSVQVSQITPSSQCWGDELQVHQEMCFGRPNTPWLSHRTESLGGYRDCMEPAHGLLRGDRAD